MSVVAILSTIEVSAALVALGLIVVLAHRRQAFRRRSAWRWAMEDAARGRPAARISLDSRAALMSAAALAVAAAAILSVWQSDPSRVAPEPAPVAIVFAVDVSRSMEAGDVAPNRLLAARALDARIVGEAAPGAVGLVVFAGEAELTCPLTSDLEAVRMALDEVPATMGTLAGGSAIADALARSAAAFSASRARKVVVLLTDGEDTGPAAAIDETAARLAAARVSVVAIGLGTANGAAMPVRKPDPDSALDPAKSAPTRVTRLDAGRLQRLARATGGQYFEGADPQTAARLVARLRAPSTRVSRAGGQGLVPAALLAAAFACLSIEWLLGLLGRRDA